MLQADMDVLDHATSEMASGSKLGIDATKELPGEGFKRPWLPLIKMDESVKAKAENFSVQRSERRRQKSISDRRVEISGDAQL